MFEPYKKGDYVIYARYAYPGEAVHNYLEGSDYITDDEKPIVLSGTVDELWTVTFDKLASTYTYSDGTPISDNDLGYRLPQSDDQWVEIRPIQDANAPIVWMEQTNPTDQVEVVTSKGEVLTANRPGIPHGTGDWIARADADGYPDEDDCWIVNGAVFENTYVPA